MPPLKQSYWYNKYTRGQTNGMGNKQDYCTFKQNCQIQFYKDIAKHFSGK